MTGAGKPINQLMSPVSKAKKAAVNKTQNRLAACIGVHQTKTSRIRMLPSQVNREA